MWSDDRVWRRVSVSVRLRVRVMVWAKIPPVLEGRIRVGVAVRVCSVLGSTLA